MKQSTSSPKIAIARPSMTLSKFPSRNSSSTLSGLHTMSKKSIYSDQRPDNENLSHTNDIATDDVPEASPQFLHHNELDEPDYPVDDSASLFNIDSSVLSSKSLGDSAVIVDHAPEESDDQTADTKDEEDFIGDNNADSSPASSTVSSDNGTPPQSVSKIQSDTAKVPEITDEQVADVDGSKEDDDSDSKIENQQSSEEEEPATKDSDVEANVESQDESEEGSDVNSEADIEDESDENSDENSYETSDVESDVESVVESDDADAVVPDDPPSKVDTSAQPQMKRSGSLIDKIKASEAFNAAKSRSSDQNRRPSLEFARHISGEQLQTLLKSVNTKDLMESSDNEAVRETLMHIQQAALEEVQEQEEKKGVVDEMLEAIATSSGVSELAGAIQEQLRSQEVIEEAAERERVGSSDSTLLSEDEIAPESLKEPEEPIIHVDLSSCSSRASSNHEEADEMHNIPDMNAQHSVGSRFLSPSNYKPMLDYDEYWREYGLQFIFMLIFTVLALVMNVLVY